MKINLEEIKNLISALEEGGVSEFEYEDEDSRLRLSFGKGGAHTNAAPALQHAAQSSLVAAPSVAPPDDADVVFITSPFVGTFYRAASPDADSFTDVGKSISVGQTLCIVEAMKLMNEIESDVAGMVLEILVSNGNSVEFGQKLFKVKKG